MSARFGRRRMLPAAAILCGCLMALPLWVGIIWGLSAVLRHMGVVP